MRPFSEEMLTAYLDDELSEDERALVEKTTQQNEHMAKLLSDLRAVRDAVQALPDLTPTVDPSQAVRKRIENQKVTRSTAEQNATRLGRLIVGASAACVLLGLTAFLLQPHQPVAFNDHSSPAPGAEPEDAIPNQDIATPTQSASNSLSMEQLEAANSVQTTAPSDAPALDSFMPEPTAAPPPAPMAQAAPEPLEQTPLRSKNVDRARHLGGYGASAPYRQPPEIYFYAPVPSGQQLRKPSSNTPSNGSPLERSPGERGLGRSQRRAFADTAADQLKQANRPEPAGRGAFGGGSSTSLQQQSASGAIRLEATVPAESITRSISDLQDILQSEGLVAVNPNPAKVEADPREPSFTLPDPDIEVNLPYVIAVWGDTDLIGRLKEKLENRFKATQLTAPQGTNLAAIASKSQDADRATQTLYFAITKNTRPRKDR